MQEPGCAATGSGVRSCRMRGWGLREVRPGDPGHVAAGSRMCSHGIWDVWLWNPRCAAVGSEMLGHGTQDARPQDAGCSATGLCSCRIRDAWPRDCRMQMLLAHGYLWSWRLSRRTRLWLGSRTPASSRSSSVMSLGRGHRCRAQHPQEVPSTRLYLLGGRRSPLLKLLGAHPEAPPGCLQWGSRDPLEPAKGSEDPSQVSGEPPKSSRDTPGQHPMRVSPQQGAPPRHP